MDMSVLSKKDCLTLGLETGGTYSTWVLLDQGGKVIQSGRENAGNWKIVGHRGFGALLKALKKNLIRQPGAVGACIAGCSSEKDEKELLELFQKVFSKTKAIKISQDTESAFISTLGKRDGILVIAGTGSNVIAKKGDRRWKAGGWGHLAGDPGSAYDIASHSVKAAFEGYDAMGKTDPIARKLLSHTSCSQMDELITWLYSDSNKAHLASLAEPVLQLAIKNKRAREIVFSRIGVLAGRVYVASRRAGIKKPAIGLSGGLFQKSSLYRKLFEKAVKEKIPHATFHQPRIDGAVAAAQMVANIFLPEISQFQELPSLSAIATEDRNPRSRELHKKTVSDLVEVFIREEAYVRKALDKAKASITEAVELVSKKMLAGGKLFYIGAGTSGRLGILDASEMPPTFGVSPDLVQGIIAGGNHAITHAVEGAEDDRASGKRAVKDRGMTSKDVLVGIAASGRTPYVQAALKEASALKVSTVLVTCNPRLKLASEKWPDVTIKLPVGAEIITGSTRLKSGTVTKLVLNMISSISMIRSGHVYDNLMIHVMPTNDKLKARTIRLVKTILGCDEREAKSLLVSHQWKIDRCLKLM